MGITRSDFAPSVEPIEKGLSTNRPSNPVEGRVRYETDTDELVVYNGSTWTGVGGGGDTVESTDVTNIVVLSQAAYDALSPPDATTLYIIT
jgi:hypothetical protein